MPATITGERYTKAMLAVTEDLVLALGAHFAPDEHGHFISHIQGLADALVQKQASLGYTPLNALALGQPDGAAKLGPDGKLLATHVPAGFGGGTGGGGNLFYIVQDEATGKYLWPNPDTGVPEEVLPGGEGFSRHIVGYTDPKTVEAFSGQLRDFWDWWYPLIPPPADLAIERKSDVGYRLTWAAVPNATRYRVLVLRDSDGQPAAGFNLVAVAGTFLDVTGLTPNTPYRNYVLAEFDAEAGGTTRTFITLALLDSTLTFTLDSQTLSLNPEHYWLLKDAGAVVAETVLLDSSTHANAQNGIYVPEVTFQSDALATNYPDVKSAYFNPSGLTGGGTVNLAGGKEMVLFDRMAFVFSAKKPRGFADRSFLYMNGAGTSSLLKIRANDTDAGMIDVFWRSDSGNTVIGAGALMSTSIYASTSEEVFTTIAFLAQPAASGTAGLMDCALLINAGLPSEQRVVLPNITARLTTVSRVTFANNYSHTTGMNTTFGNKVKMSRVALWSGANTPTEAQIRNILAKGTWQ